jgi:hypothetical protein
MIKTYAPGQTILSIGGNLISGFMDGTFITVEREVDAYTKVTGADGEVSRTRNANRSGSLTMTLKQTSNSNYVMGGIAALDETADGGIVDVLIQDNLGNVSFAGQGWVRKQPNQELAAEQTGREWIMDLSRVDFTYPVPS